jgi:hypothetical protein
VVAVAEFVITGLLLDLVFGKFVELVEPVVVETALVTALIIT